MGWRSRSLRAYFLHHRELLGKLSQSAWETVHELIAEAAGDDEAIRPGMVSVIQTATDLLEWSPHVHTCWFLVAAGIARATGVPCRTSMRKRRSFSSDTK